MSDLQDPADHVAIQTLRAEFSDAVMMRDYDRLASLFTAAGVIRMPHINTQLVGRKEIRAAVERLQGLWSHFVQLNSLGAIQIEGDAASGRAYISESGRLHDGNTHLNYGIYHDRYLRTREGWKFAERVYEVRYVDHCPPTGAAPSIDTNTNPPPDLTPLTGG